MIRFLLKNDLSFSNTFPFLAISLCLFQVVTAQEHVARAPASWYAYGGDAGGNRYVRSDQINSENVMDLKPAWTFRTGELGQNSSIAEKLTFEATPIFFDNRLYLSTSYGKVFALDPTSGTELWSYDPKIDRNASFSELTSRGVSSWTDPDLHADEACKKCIVLGTIHAKLIKLDAITGKPCKNFGKKGVVDLYEGVFVAEKGDYQTTSPPAIYQDLAITGSSIGDNFNADTGNGSVRAFSLRTGKLVWSWDPLAEARSTFKGPVGAANAWSVLSVDVARDLVFVPTGSASPDFYGGYRPGDNRYANSVVALKASTGQLVWHFQTVHHDLWDYDVAAQPALVEIRKDGKIIPAVVQATKTGNLFVLHRETGEPIYPIEERTVPQSDIPGEETAPTQPFSSLPNLMGQVPLTAATVWGKTPEERQKNARFIAKFRNEGLFTPPSVQGSVLYPGNGSGTNWGSVSYDMENQLLIANTCRFATLVELFEQDEFVGKRADSKGFEVSRQRGAPYAMRRRTMIGESGTLMNPPPWGTLAAVNLSTGQLEWETALGTSEDGLSGLPNAGGSIVTAGGLVFIAATFDKKFRAFSSADGTVLWETELPRCGIATPMSYVDKNGKQFVVIAAGGHGKMGPEIGDFLMAFSL
ncbi:pyrroloquinoline quinone-dependent dehydrogenase [Maribacter sp. 2-571]|uniref:pyrroloquinoline quinone-dependent dehydrogenase n=1 Tax=Maribacter sp. 2-571 TaxID=3417569 RepID=UPI003D34A399